MDLCMHMQSCIRLSPLHTPTHAPSRTHNRYVLFYQGRQQLLASSARLAQVLRDKLEGPPPPSPSPARPPKDAAHGGAQEGGVRVDLFLPVSAKGGPEHAQAPTQQPPSEEDAAAAAADDGRD